MSVTRALRWRLERTVFGSLRRGLLLLPHPFAWQVGRALGALFLMLATGHRRQARANLELALPQLDPAERSRILRSSFLRFGASLADSISATRFSREDLLQRIDLAGSEHLDEAARLGPGILFVTAHVGPWEIVGPVVARAAPAFVISTTPLKNPLLGAAVAKSRERWGVREIPRHRAAIRLFKALRQGSRVLVALDHRTRYEEAVAVRFLGQRSLTSPIPAYVCTRLEAPAVPVFARGRGDAYSVGFGAPVMPVRGTTNDTVATTQRYVDAIDEEIRADPAAWTWFYRRWRPEWDQQAGSSLANGAA